MEMTVTPGVKLCKADVCHLRHFTFVFPASVLFVFCDIMGVINKPGAFPPAAHEVVHGWHWSGLSTLCTALLHHAVMWSGKSLCRVSCSPSGASAAGRGKGASD